MYSSHWLAPHTHSHMFGLANPNVHVCVRRTVPDIVDYTLEDDDDDAAFYYIVCSLLCVLADIFGWSLCVKKALLPHTNCKVFFIFIIRILCVDTSFIYYYLIIITQDYGSDVDKVKVKKRIVVFAECNWSLKLTCGACACRCLALSPHLLMCIVTNYIVTYDATRGR